MCIFIFICSSDHVWSIDLHADAQRNYLPCPWIFLSLFFLSVCLSVRLSDLVFPCPPLRLSHVSLWLEWWFRAYCEVSNPIQSQPESRGGGEVDDGGRDTESRRGWETERIMGVLIAGFMLSGALGQFGTLTCPLLYLLLSFSNLVHGPLRLFVFLCLYLPHNTPPSSSPSLVWTLCPSHFFFFTLT